LSNFRELAVGFSRSVKIAGMNDS